MAYLTTKQVIELLHIDRTTLYRMLKDGRLHGVKVGSQWRFKEEDVNRLIHGSNPVDAQKMKDFDESLPFTCIVPIQDVIADIASIGVVIADTEGQQMTEISNSCEFCQLVRSSEKGKNACDASWKKITKIKSDQSDIIPCHTGLRYAKANIHEGGGIFGTLIAGQFITDTDKTVLSPEKIKEIAEKYNIKYEELLEASKKVEVLDKRWENRIEVWLGKIAKTFESVIRERNSFLSRFKQIIDIIDFEGQQ